MLVDTHCHLGDPQFAIDRDAVVHRAVDAGVGQGIIVGDSVAGSETAVDLARRYGWSATAGIHPHVAVTWDRDAAERISRALADPHTVAVGETGLDYHYDHSPRATQRQVFEAQLELAATLSKPVVIHARDADDDVAAMLQAWATTVPAVVLHSFSSGRRLFDVGIAIGAYFSFSGMVTFGNWPYRDAVTACPADRVLIETDAPYLAPVPHRGRRNEPAFTVHVATTVAGVRGLSAGELAVLSTNNATRCFGNRVASTARVPSL